MLVKNAVSRKMNSDKRRLEHILDMCTPNEQGLCTAHDAFMCYGPKPYYSDALPPAQATHCGGYVVRHDSSDPTDRTFPRFWHAGNYCAECQLKIRTLQRRWYYKYKKLQQ